MTAYQTITAPFKDKRFLSLPFYYLYFFAIYIYIIILTAPLLRPPWPSTPWENPMRWISAHCGYEGNELVDKLAKRGSNNDRASRIKLPMPRCVCYAALRRKTIVSCIEFYKLNPPKMFNILWRDKFSKDLIRMNKRHLRAATQILTGHACLNYHLSKLNRSVQPLCPLCEAEYDTVPHLLAKCPMLWQ